MKYFQLTWPKLRYPLISANVLTSQSRAPIVPSRYFIPTRPTANSLSESLLLRSFDSMYSSTAVVTSPLLSLIISSTPSLLSTYLLLFIDSPLTTLLLLAVLVNAFFLVEVSVLVTFLLFDLAVFFVSFAVFSFSAVFFRDLGTVFSVLEVLD